MRNFRLLLLQLGFLAAGQAYGAIYEYHPNSILYLGGGYNPYKPDQIFQECVVHDGVKPLDDPDATESSAVNTEVVIQTVKSKQDFYSLINFSAQIQGSYGIYSGGGSVNLVDEQAFHSDSLTWVILFKSDYGKFGLRNPRLRSNVISLGDPESIYDKCGSEVVVQERRGVMTYAVLTVKNLNQSKRYEFSQKLSLSAKAGIWSASMDQSYQKILRSALSSTDFSIRIKALGGNGIVDLTELLGDEEDSFTKYMQIPSVMKAYIGKQTVENSVPIQYATAHISSFRQDVPTKYADFAFVQFRKIFESYEAISAIHSRLEKLLFGSDHGQYLIAAEDESKFIDLYNSYGQAQSRLYEAGLECFKDHGSCVIPPLELDAVDWPLHTKFLHMCEQNRKDARDAGLVPEEFYQMAKRRDLVFIIENGRVTGQSPCLEVYF